MNRLLPALLLLGLAGALAAQGPGGPGLEALLRVEERLFADDLAAYREAREQERAAAADLEELAARLDAALGSAVPRLEDLEQIELERAVAQAAAEVVGRRAAEIRLRILERLRRSGALRRAILQGGVLPAPADPIGGRWRVEISSPRQEGTFDLTLEGTVVRGTYSFEGGRSGSLRGTYVAGRLSLERIDAERGLDGLFEGTVEPAVGVVRGFWSPTVLSGGAPGGAGWTGVRLAAEEQPREPAGEGEE